MAPQYCPGENEIVLLSLTPSVSDSRGLQVAQRIAVDVPPIGGAIKNMGYKGPEDARLYSSDDEGTVWMLFHAAAAEAGVVAAIRVVSLFASHVVF